MIGVFLDTISDAWTSIRTRISHHVLISLGAMVGVGAVVLTLGLTTTLRAQVSAEFDALAATELTLEISKLGDVPEQFSSTLRSRPGVRRAGLYYQVVAGHGRSSTTWSGQVRGQEFPVFALDIEAIRIARPDIRGPGIAKWMAERGENVVLIGAAVARQFGYSNPGSRPEVIFVGDRPLGVAGIIANVERHPELLSAVIVPVKTAQTLGFLSSGTVNVLVETAPGAARVVARRARLALRPEDPAAVKLIEPPDPKSLRQAIDANIARLLIALASVSLILGGIEIGTSMLVSVMGRVNEIGLRRALGSSRGRVALLFLVESAATGSLGGAIGAALGTLGVSALSLAQRWQAVIDPWLPPVAILFGSLVGLAAGGYPAYVASRIEPAEALRR